MRVLIALASGSLAVAGWPARTESLIALMLGVFAGALAESDDSWRGQLRAQLTILCSFSVVAILVRWSLSWPGLPVVVLSLVAFGLTLLGVLGERYRTLAFATLIMALYTALASQAQPQPAQGLLGWLLGGAAWYGVVAVSWAAVLPMWPVRQRLAALYDVLGDYLQLKSQLLLPVAGLDRERQRLALALHNGRVVEALNAAKESLRLRSDPAIAPPGLPAALHLYFVAQDVHERVTSSHAHYDVLARNFFHSDVLYRIQRVGEQLGRDCHALALAALSPSSRLAEGDAGQTLKELGVALAYQEKLASRGLREAPDAGSVRALRALIENLASMAQQLAAAREGRVPARSSADAALLNRQPASLREAWQRLRAQASLSSPLLRHAVRLGLVALPTGGLVMQWADDSHGYWILLTIVFVCQPQYGATLTRLAQRIWGTLLGLLIGWALLRLFPELWVQSVFAVMAGGYFFVARHTYYLRATAAVTALVLLSFNQVGDGFDLIAPRLIDTLVGSLIAGLSVWLVLPNWRQRRLPRLAGQALRTQQLYLQQIVDQYRSGKQDHLSYRLARRNAHNADAALSAALQVALEEPARVRRHCEAGTRFLVLSHTLLSYLSALGAHRHLRVESEAHSTWIRAADCLAQQLGVLADALAAGHLQRLPDGAGLAALASEADAGQSDAAGVLLSQLVLALQLLSPLAEQAAALLAPAAAGARPLGAGRFPTACERSVGGAER